MAGVFELNTLWVVEDNESPLVSATPIKIKEYYCLINYYKSHVPFCVSNEDEIVFINPNRFACFIFFLGGESIFLKYEKLMLIIRVEHLL
jgi:hypothetical protein